MATLAIAALAITACGRPASPDGDQDEAAPNLAPRASRSLRAAPEYKAVEGSGGGLRQATLYSQGRRGPAAGLEVRSLLLLPKESVLPSARDTLYEVLTGEVDSESAGLRKHHAIGDLWLVGKGEHMTARATGEIAVLRAIIVSPN